MKNLGGPQSPNMGAATYSAKARQIIASEAGRTSVVDNHAYMYAQTGPKASKR